LTTGQLAELRRGLLRLLDGLGPSLPDENLAQRIQRMSRSNLIPRNVATCMHIIREMRSVAEYNAKTISPAETLAIEGALGVIREWAQEQKLALPDLLKENPGK